MVKNRETAKAATSATRKREQTTSRNTQPPRLILRDEELYERVARKAYELYQQRGEEHGHDFEDWLTAERLVQAELLHGPLPEEPPMEDRRKRLSLLTSAKDSTKVAIFPNEI